jgi:hypothetical protein
MLARNGSGSGKDEVGLTPTRVDTIWEADEAEAPAFGMG